MLLHRSTNSRVWRRTTLDLAAMRMKEDGEFLYGQRWCALAGNDCVGPGNEQQNVRGVEQHQ